MTGEFPNAHNFDGYAEPDDGHTAASSWVYWIFEDLSAGLTSPNRLTDPGSDGTMAAELNHGQERGGNAG